MDKAQRLAYALSTQRQWLGVRVYADRRGEGVIDYITCLNPKDLHELVLLGMESESSPFRFHLVADDGRGLGLASVCILRRIVVPEESK